MSRVWEIHQRSHPKMRTYQSPDCPKSYIYKRPTPPRSIPSAGDPSEEPPQEEDLSVSRLPQILYIPVRAPLTPEGPHSLGASRVREIHQRSHPKKRTYQCPDCPKSYIY
ncbi:hypothetical protein AB205_0054020, partial [Aquarana catesbeiana]